MTDVVPSKTLIATAAAAEAIREAASLGIQISSGDGSVSVDLESVNKRLLDLAKAQSKQMSDTLVEAGVRVVPGSAKLDGNHVVLVEAQDG